MEQCIQHGELTRTTEKVLNLLEEIKTALMGDITDPDKVGIMSRMTTLEIKVESLEKAKNSLLNIAFKILVALAVSGISIKAILESIK